jgi:hypothetical protein
MLRNIILVSLATSAVAARRTLFAADVEEAVVSPQLVATQEIIPTLTVVPERTNERNFDDISEVLTLQEKFTRNAAAAAAVGDFEGEKAALIAAAAAAVKGDFDGEKKKIAMMEATSFDVDAIDGSDPRTRPAEFFKSDAAVQMVA